MKTLTKPIETTGILEKSNRLLLDEPLVLDTNVRLRIVIFPDFEDIPEDEWLRAAARNQAFQEWNDPEEDIYSPDEGVPFDEHR